jgi:fatty-acyl-CoA synthase
MLCEVAPELPRSAPGGLSSKDVPMLSHVIIADLEPASEKTFPGTLSLQDVVDAASAESKLDLEKAEKENQLDDAINLQFTSGKSDQLARWTMLLWEVDSGNIK